MFNKFLTKDIKKFLDARDLPKIERILDRLDVVITAKDMNIPGWRLHELKGGRKGERSVTVRDNGRITFRFEEGEAHDVNLEDYH